LIAPAPLAIQNTVSYNPNETRSLRHVEAYFGQAELDFYNQLHVTAGLRNDAFSTFGTSNRNALYPKVDAAWTFSNWFNNGAPAGTGRFSNGRLRAAYGETGREPPVYATISALSTTSLFGSGFQDFIGSKQSGQGGVVSGFNLGNPDLRPERNREAEIGADLGFFNQATDFSVSYYNKRSTAVILPVPVNAAATGAGTQLVNGATVTNKGVNCHSTCAHIPRRTSTSRSAATMGGTSDVSNLSFRECNSFPITPRDSTARSDRRRSAMRRASCADRTSCAADLARKSRCRAWVRPPTWIRHAAPVPRRERSTSRGRTSVQS